MIPGNMVKGGRVYYSDWYPMDTYAGDRVDDPTNPLYDRNQSGGAIDIHKAILKVAPKKRFCDAWS